MLKDKSCVCHSNRVSSILCILKRHHEVFLGVTYELILDSGANIFEWVKVRADLDRDDIILSQNIFYSCCMGCNVVFLENANSVSGG